MSRIQIKNLEIRNFRGIRQECRLPINGRSVLLFGENGTGKSSFLDAIEKVFTGSVSVLDDRAQGISSDRHGPHIRAGNDPTEISVTFTDDSTVTLNPATFDSLSEEAKSYIEVARLNLHCLRRGTLSNLIESMPKDRYDLLRPYFQISKIEQMEEAFKEVAAQFLVDLNQTKREHEENDFRIRQTIDFEPDSELTEEAHIVSRLSSMLEDAGWDRLLTLDEIESRLQSLRTELAKFGNLERQSLLTSVIESMAGVKRSIGEIDSQQFLKELRALKEKETSEAHLFFEKVLEEGSQWIEKGKLDKCPLCGQQFVEFSAKEILQHIQDRLGHMRELLNVRDGFQEIHTIFRRKFDRARTNIENASIQVAKLPESDRLEPHDSLESMKTLVDKILQITAGVPTKINEDGLSDACQPISSGGSAIASLDESKERLQETLKSYPSPKGAQEILKLVTVLSNVPKAWLAFQKSQVMVAERGLHFAAASAIYEAFQAARKDALRDLFEEISADVDTIYKKLYDYHLTEDGGEPSHRNISVELRDAFQGSINLRGDYYEKAGEDPRAYYSEGRLDILGISIFLALRRWLREQYPEFDLVIMDDILTSIDSGHAAHLSQFLLKEFSNYQILLTTHDRIWFEHLRDIQQRCGVSQNFVNRVIHKWTIDEGPDIRLPEDEWERLNAILKDGAANEIAWLGGKLLEHILQEMRYTLQLRIPAKPGENYTIGEMWPAFMKEVQREYPTLYELARKTIDKLNVNWPLRNWIGSHHNEWTARVAREDAVDFGRAVMALFELLYCKECRRFIVPSRTPRGQIACPCGELIYSAKGKDPLKVETRVELVERTEGVLKDANLTSEQHLKRKHAERVN